MTLATDRKPAAKVTWEERAKKARRKYPSITKLNAGDGSGWKTAFGGVGEISPVFARIMRDVLKDDAEPGRPGPRPGPDYDSALAKLRQFSGRDFTTLPFVEALGILSGWKPNGGGRLAGNVSVTTLARKSSLSRSQVHRLLAGETEPSIAEIEALAGAFNKQPAFFVEWRLQYLLTHVAKRLEDLPENTIDYYRELRG